jgi:importin subunit beta-1
LDNIHGGYAVMDAQLVVGAVATALGIGFRKYYKFILPYIKRGLENGEDYQVCQTATELISDVARAVHESILEDTPMLVQYLLRNLANEDMNRIVKPVTISAFGDIALALNERFEPYADHVLAVLDKAASIAVPKDDQDMVEYLNEIRENILETYTAILQALGSQAALRVFPKRLDLVLNFLVTITREVSEPDSQVTEAVIKGAVGLLGDVCKVLGPEARHKVQSAVVVFNQLVKICSDSDDQDMIEVATYCMRQITGR